MAMRGDFNVLKFNTYEEYLRSFTRMDEYRYLSSKRMINSLIKLGYRTNTTIYEEAEFYELQKNLLLLLNPKKATTTLFSSHLKSTDPALVALATREEPNMQKKLSTIILLQLRQRSGFDISGYIDYEDSLSACAQHKLGALDWKGIFEGRILLRPNQDHLSFYDWHSGKISINHSGNYDIVHYGTSLMFKHKGDHRFVPVTVVDNMYKDNVKRSLYISPIYGCVILYDHVVRKAT
ncbi:cilia- and flagella-associated protein 299 [Drosophila mojavensis]|uniref:Cilia- and flagella-associated protein 299 n=1 Tax=Drosophila mojavensis TaxID=7230 RepID=B4KIR7_DROMO|nr:cilia- and flagella-associated protein 299 [Drosophila mojavensis]EDW12423.1 uncharacterized protein Dmoj_GI17674 [Drosophila mojavensis]